LGKPQALGVGSYLVLPLFLVALVDFFLCARGDVVDINRRIFPEIFHIVDAAAGPLLDRTTRLVILLVPLLAPESLRRSRGAEVGAAIATARPGRESAWAAGPWAEPTRARTAKPTTAPRRTGPTKAATGTGTAEASRSGPGWAILPGAGFADRQVAPLEGLRVEFLDDVFGDGAICKLDERKAAWTAGLAIDRHDDMGRFCDRGKVGAEIRLTCRVRQVPDEQTDCQGSLVKSAALAAGIRFYPSTGEQNGKERG
jgi:hypothetical protein